MQREGSSRREHLNSAREQLARLARPTDDIDHELRPLEVPPGFEWLYGTFWSVNSGRGEGINGPLPLSFTELKAYCELMNETLTPWEVETLKSMDRAFLDEVTKEV